MGNNSHGRRGPRTSEAIDNSQSTSQLVRQPAGQSQQRKRCHDGLDVSRSHGPEALPYGKQTGRDLVTYQVLAETETAKQQNR